MFGRPLATRPSCPTHTSREPPSAAAGIENAVCEQAGPGAYRITFDAPREAGAIAVYASSRADRIDTKDPVLKGAKSPAQVTVPVENRRVYFHLKPASGPTRVVAVRKIAVEGAPNFRDIGGYRTTDGKHVRWGLLYRTGNFAKLTEKDYELLSSLGIKLVCDFRLDFERERAPTKWMGKDAPEILLLPMDTFTNLPPDSEMQKRMMAVYDRFPTMSAPEVRTGLLRFVKGDLPATFHCSAGKDRTGMFAAFLLTALGVPRETVTEDFLLTNKNLTPDAVSVEWLNKAFDSITAKYGTFDKYLKDGLNLTDADLKTLRSRLLED